MSDSRHPANRYGWSGSSQSCAQGGRNSDFSGGDKRPLSDLDKIRAFNGRYVTVTW